MWPGSPDDTNGSERAPGNGIARQEKTGCVMRPISSRKEAAQRGLLLGSCLPRLYLDCSRASSFNSTLPCVRELLCQVVRIPAVPRWPGCPPRRPSCACVGPSSPFSQSPARGGRSGPRGGSAGRYGPRGGHSAVPASDRGSAETSLTLSPTWKRVVYLP